MKTLFLLLSLFSISSSNAQEWKFLFEIKNVSYYYKPNTDETAWIKLVSDKIEYYPEVTSSRIKTIDGYKVLLYKFDCSSKKIGVIKSSVYSKDGDVIDIKSVKDYLVEMDYVNPDSVGEDFLILFCGNY